MFSFLLTTVCLRDAKSDDTSTTVPLITTSIASVTSSFAAPSISTAATAASASTSGVSGNSAATATNANPTTTITTATTTTTTTTSKTSQAAIVTVTTTSSATSVSPTSGVILAIGIELQAWAFRSLTNFGYTVIQISTLNSLNTNIYEYMNLFWIYFLCSRNWLLFCITGILLIAGSQWLWAHWVLSKRLVLPRNAIWKFAITL